MFVDDKHFFAPHPVVSKFEIDLCWKPRKSCFLNIISCFPFEKCLELITICI